MKWLVYFLFLATWMGGVVIAAGFWSTIIAIFIPLWAWYLVTEKLLHMIGWV